MNRVKSGFKKADKTYAKYGLPIWGYIGFVSSFAYTFGYLPGWIIIPMLFTVSFHAAIYGHHALQMGFHEE